MLDIKHSVLMITYNQEHLVSEALDSLFANKIIPYEVIVIDDCSEDNTWNIILDYNNKYPSVIKSIKNDKNIGVIKNFNKIKSMPSGNIVSFLSGDDMFMPNMFEIFNNAILKESIDLNFEKFAIITNTIYLYPNGKKNLYNNYCLRKYDLFKARIRYSIDYRMTGISFNSWKLIPDLNENIGYNSDWIIMLDESLSIDKKIFVNEIGAIYRVGVGVVSKTKNYDMMISKLKVINKIRKKYKNKLDKLDLLYLEKEFFISYLQVKRNYNIYIQSMLLVFRNILNFNYYRLHFVLRDLKLLLSFPIIKKNI